MVLEAPGNLKQLGEGLRHLKRILEVHLEVINTCKMVLKASSNLKQLWEALIRF